MNIALVFAGAGKNPQGNLGNQPRTSSICQPWFFALLLWLRTPAPKGGCRLPPNIRMGHLGERKSPCACQPDDSGRSLAIPRWPSTWVVSVASSSWTGKQPDSKRGWPSARGTRRLISGNPQLVQHVGTRPGDLHLTPPCPCKCQSPEHSSIVAEVHSHHQGFVERFQNHRQWVLVGTRFP